MRISVRPEGRQRERADTYAIRPSWRVLVCEHCGMASTDPRHISKPKLEKINFVCAACGRVAQLPSQLYDPRDIVLMANQEPPTRIV